MRPSPHFLGAMMIALGGWPVFAALQHGDRPSALALLVALLLVVAGGTLMMRRPLGFWLAIAAAATTAALGAIGLATGRELGLPLPSVVSLAVGLYIGFRAVLARGGLGEAPRRDIEPDEPATG